MITKYIVVVYTASEEIECNSEREADVEIDRQNRLYGNICRVRMEEYDEDEK